MSYEFTDEELSFIEKHNLRYDEFFDASGLGAAEYRDLMRQYDKKIAFGVTPCKKYGHRLRSRNGHCIICKPEVMAYGKRFSSDSNIYIAFTEMNGFVKFGVSNDLNERLNHLNKTTYAGVSDWEMVAYTNCSNAGSVEWVISRKFKNRRVIGRYYNDGKDFRESSEVYNIDLEEAISFLKDFARRAGVFVDLR